MAELKDKVNAEIENISVVLEELKGIKDKPNKNTAELAGIGTFLHNIYNGIENILKQILISEDIKIPSSESWHQDLLIQATDKKIITETTEKQLARYLAFRHFFIHAYGFMLDEQELKLLADDVFNVYSSFKTEIDFFMSK